MTIQTIYQINPLAIIRQWIDTEPMDCDLSHPRSILASWVKRHFPQFTPGEITLAVDCLIAVGIGEDSQQFATVAVTAEASYTQHEVNSDAQHRFTGEPKKFYENP